MYRLVDINSSGRPDIILRPALEPAESVSGAIRRAIIANEARSASAIGMAPQRKSVSPTLVGLSGQESVILGRHTELPEQCRIPHFAVSRHHVRIEAVPRGSQQMSQQQQQATSPLAAAAAAEEQPSGNTSSKSKKKKKTATKKAPPQKHARDGSLLASQTSAPTQPSQPPSAPFQLTAIGLNPVFVNGAQVARDVAVPLREYDVVSFLENAFDSDAGILTRSGNATAAATPTASPSELSGFDRREGRLWESLRARGVELRHGNRDDMHGGGAAVAGDEADATDRDTNGEASPLRPSLKQRQPLPVYVLARRSPSPEAGTRQAANSAVVVVAAAAKKKPKRRQRY